MRPRHRLAPPIEPLEPRRLLAAGDLDPTFSFDGKVLNDYQGQYDEGRAVAVQPNGDVVVAATLSDPNAFFYLGAVRYLGSGPNAGELDPTFGADGTGFVNTGIFGTPSSVVIQPDGKIVLGGYSRGVASEDFTVVRLTTTGRLDPTFGQVAGTARAGFARADFNGRDDYCNALALLADGSILAGGNTQLAGNPNTNAIDFAVAKFDANGALDNAFSPGGNEGSGRATIDMGFADIARGIAVQPNGRILLAGVGSPNSTTNTATIAVARLTATAPPDPNFDADGRAYVPSAGFNTEAFAVALQSDGKIVTLGAPRIASPAIMFLSRLNPDGSPAPFPDAPNNHLTVLEGAQFLVPGGLAVQFDDRVLASAFYSSTVAAPNNGFVILRRNADGTKEDDGDFDSFNNGDPRHIAFGPSPDRTSGARAVALARDGKVVVAGFTDSGGGTRNVAVARFQNVLRTPYTGRFPRPGETLQAEEFDYGGDFVSYFDNDPANTGNANFRTAEAVDIHTGGTGRVVRMETAETLIYSFQVDTLGSYAFELRAATLGNTDLRVTVASAAAPGQPEPYTTFTSVRLADTGGAYVTALSDSGMRLPPGRYFLGIQSDRVMAPTPGGNAPDFVANLDSFRLVPDTFGPKVSFGSFNYFAPPIGVEIDFNEDVAASLSTFDFSLQNLTTGEFVNPLDLRVESLFGQTDSVLTLPNNLPRGNYRLTLFASGVVDASGNPLDGNGDGTPGDNYTLTFFHLPGDATRDRKVDFNDLVRVAQHYNTPGAKFFTDGDFNYDRKVDFLDLVTLAQNYNDTLPPVPTASPTTAYPAAPHRPNSATSLFDPQPDSPFRSLAPTKIRARHLETPF